MQAAVPRVSFARSGLHRSRQRAFHGEYQSSLTNSYLALESAHSQKVQSAFGCSGYVTGLAKRSSASPFDRLLVDTATPGISGCERGTRTVPIRSQSDTRSVYMAQD